MPLKQSNKRMWRWARKPVEIQPHSDLLATSLLTLDGKSTVVLMPNKNLGNFLLSTAAISAIFSRYANDNLLLVIDEYYLPLAQQLFPDKPILAYPRRSLKRAKGFEKLAVIRKFIGQLRRFNPDVAIDIDGDRSGGSLAWLSGAALRIGPKHSKRHGFFTHIYASRMPLTHRSQDYSNMAALFGTESGVVGYAPFHLNNDDAEHIQQRLKSCGVNSNQPLVSMHVSASMDYKQWQAQKFAEVVLWLHQQGYQVVLVGAGGHDLRKVKEVCALVGELSLNNGVTLLNWCNQLSLVELAALYHQSAFFVGNDSGPMHLAAATGIPVFAIYGPTIERKWGPLGEASTVIRHPDGCEPHCQQGGGETCPKQRACMGALNSDTVIETIKVVTQPHPTHAGETSH